VPYARADRAVLASAVGLLALLTTGVVFGLANFEPYPRITVATDLTELLYAALIVLAALAAPIIGERGRRR
jgi:hypothetical protein